MVPNSTVLTVAVIFESWLLKMAAARKKYLCNQVEVEIKINHTVINLLEKHNIQSEHVALKKNFSCTMEKFMQTKY